MIEAEQDYVERFYSIISSYYSNDISRHFNINDCFECLQRLKEISDKLQDKLTELKMVKQ